MGTNGGRKASTPAPLVLAPTLSPSSDSLFLQLCPMLTLVHSPLLPCMALASLSAPLPISLVFPPLHHPRIQLLSSFCHSHCPYWGCFPPALGPLLLLRSFLFVPLQKSNCCPYCLFSHIPVSWFLCLPSPKECLELPNSTATHLGHDPLPCKHVPSFPSLSRPGRLGLLPRKPTM